MAQAHEQYPDVYHDINSKTVFGFWVYLLSDFILFATLFATFGVLGKNAFGGPSGHELYNLPLILAQTFILLAASFASGIGSVYVHRRDKQRTLIFFLLTALLGVAFLWIELSEFSRFVQSGNSWKKSAYLSTYFSLVGTHGLHIVFAVLWTFIFLPLVYLRGITESVVRKMTCLKMFWQFLNIVWIFIFTLVYLLGAELS